MKSSEIREIFFSFFFKKKHHKVLSSPLIPAKDPTLLFTNAGMNQFKSVFLQEEEREYQRAVSIQKCMRVSGKHNDFNEVGKSDFHHTFFEMMGNFSFGDYFKEGAIEYAWELLTQNYHFQPDSLWATVYKDDDEAFKIWEKNIGLPGSRIIRCGEKDNFWQMGETGPCGPCSEVHFDRGEEFGPAEITDKNPRFVEIWNLVFMQYNKTDDGKLHPLPAPSIDTGMGMERLTTLLQGKKSNYETDLFQPIKDFTAEQAGIDPAAEKHQVDLNVVADHIRALTFLVADGILPANDGRGYVLRRILRRAAKHGKALGFDKPFLHQVSGRVIEVMKEFYPELDYNRTFIAEVIQSEEERFSKTLLNGLKRFEDLLEDSFASKVEKIDGRALFKLSDTYGFPLDFAIDLANEKDIGVDLEGFEVALDQQREKSRISLKNRQKAHGAMLLGDKKLESNFTGYESLEEESTVIAILVDQRQTEKIQENQQGYLILDKTPFYAESGGQVGDTGQGKTDSSYFEISDTVKGPADLALHQVIMRKGSVRQGEKVRVTVNESRRQQIAIHHTSTHLLHHALREVLGLHVKQSGSYVGPDKLRFDFTHFKALTREELANIEALINNKIRGNNQLGSDIVKYEVAIQRGAIAIFEEKYSDVVRLISVGDFSKELCGGTHLHATGEIGLFNITSESSISAGIRRIEAVAGKTAYQTMQRGQATLNNILLHFKQKEEDVLPYLKTLEQQLKEKEKQIRKTKVKEGAINLDEIIQQGTTINNIQAVVEFIDNLDRKQLSTLSDEIMGRIKGIAVLSTNINGKSAIVISISKDFTKKLNAGIIIKEIADMIGGNGGGRPDFAQAGGEQITDVPEFKKNTTGIIRQHLG